VAQAAAATLSEMNTFVSVSAAASPGADEASLASLLAASPPVHILVLSHPSAARAAAAGAACRAAGVAVFWARVWGGAGAFLADLGPSHSAASALKKAAPEAQPGQPQPPPPPPPPPRLMRYVPLARALAAPPSQLKPTTAPALWLLRAAADAEAAGCSLEAAAAALAAAAPAAAAALAGGALASLAAPESPPIAAIVGGVMANDVLKTVSGVGEPAYNAFRCEGGARGALASDAAAQLRQQDDGGQHRHAGAGGGCVRRAGVTEARVVVMQNMHCSGSSQEDPLTPPPPPPPCASPEPAPPPQQG